MLFRRSLLITLLGLPMGLLGSSPVLAEFTLPYGLVLTHTLEGDWSSLPSQDVPQFGASVAMDNGWLAVGAPQAITDIGHGEKRNGAVFLFHYANGTWNYAQRIITGGHGDSECGWSVAMDFPLLVIGCPGADNVSPSSEAGLVQWYRFDPGSSQWNGDYGWNAWTGSRCGTDVDVVVTAPGYATLIYGCPDYNGGQGFVRPWTHTPQGGWVEGPKLEAGDAAAGAKLGTSVAISADGNMVVAGAPHATFGSHIQAGNVYAFHRNINTGTWSETDDIGPNFQPEGYTYFGTDVALADSHLLVGQPYGVVTYCPFTQNCGQADLFAPQLGYQWAWSDYDAVDAGDNPHGNPAGPQAGIFYGDVVALGPAAVSGGPEVAAVAASYADGYTFDNMLDIDQGFVALVAVDSGLSDLGNGLYPPVASDSTESMRFGASLDFGSSYRLAVGAPFAGYTVPLLPSPPYYVDVKRGKVYVFSADLIFQDGFE